MIDSQERVLDSHDIMVGADAFLQYGRQIIPEVEFTAGSPMVHDDGILMASTWRFVHFRVPLAGVDREILLGQRRLRSWSFQERLLAMEWARSTAGAITFMSLDPGFE